ncbi:MAG: F0F1 ATP synthase subunit gamma [Kiritimatiellaeota bacterium]|nr:F0F1 ATP synthase subunit gamma [Kiritimatiellota bacterium]
MSKSREFNARLNVMGGMRRVTATMKMVAVSHLHHAQVEMRLPAPFAQELRKLAIVVHQIAAFSEHRLFLPPPKRGARVLLLVMTSDRGLCGAFNANILHEARRWLHEQRARRGAIVDALYAGQKGYAALRRDLPACTHVFHVSAHPKASEVAPIASYAMNRFNDGRYDEICIAGSRLVSAMKHVAAVRRILPFTRHVTDVPGVDAPIVEPMDGRMLGAVMRLWVHYCVYLAQLHRAAGEQASRIIAMENATVNLKAMESELTLQRNRARQTAITNELTEIIGGAETLA